MGQHLRAFAGCLQRPDCGTSAKPCFHRRSVVIDRGAQCRGRLARRSWAFGQRPFRGFNAKGRCDRARKVGDWQLIHSRAKFNQQWTFAALYDGLLAASKVTGDPRYRDAVSQAGDGWSWKLLDDRFPHADDMALGQAYLDLYLDNRQPVRMADTKAILDRLIVRPDDPAKLLWWWCDALFMAPPVLARMSAATGDRRYLDYMDHEWWLTSASLYDPQEHLYFRDSGYFTKREKNGEKIFWSRGNGWVMGAFAKVLEVMPEDYPSRPKYIAQYREMAECIASLQGKGRFVAKRFARRRRVRSAGGIGLGILCLFDSLGHQPWAA